MTTNVSIWNRDLVPAAWRPAINRLNHRVPRCWVLRLVNAVSFGAAVILSALWFRLSMANRGPGLWGLVLLFGNGVFLAGQLLFSVLPSLLIGLKAQTPPWLRRKLLGVSIGAVVVTIAGVAFILFYDAMFPQPHVGM